MMVKHALALGAGLLFVAGLLAAGCSSDTTEPPPAEQGGSGGSGGGSTGGGGGGGPVSYSGSIGPVTFHGPWGGAVTELLEDPVQAGRIFAIAGGQVFRSSDAGVSWTGAADVDTDALSLEVLPDGRLLVGTLVDVKASSEQGDSWHSIKHDVEPGYSFGIQAKGIAYEPGTPGRIWIALASYETAPIWVLEDGQSSWQPWNAPAGWDTHPLNGTAQLSGIEARPDGSSGETFVFATYEESFGSGGGVFCSLDSGASFALCSTGLPNMPFHRVRLYDDVAIIAGGQIFGSAYAGIYYSTDQGANWQLSAGNWLNPIANNVIRLSSGDYLAGTYGKGLLQTADLTANWSPVGLDGMEVNGLLELASGDLLVGPEQLGSYRSSNGGATWQPSAEGLDRVEIDDACVDPADPELLLGAISSLNSGLVIHTATGIDGWGLVQSLPHPRFSLVQIGPSGRWYVVSDGPTGQANDGIYVSTDEGASFTFLGPVDGPMMDHDIIGLAEYEEGQRLIVAGRYWSGGGNKPFVSESSDGGASWTERYAGLEGSQPSRMAVAASGDLFLAVQGEQIVHLDPQMQPSNITIGGVLEDRVFDVAVCGVDASRLLAVGLTDANTAEYTVFSSHDGGASWAALDFDPEPNERPRQVASHPYDCDLIFLTTWAGRLLSSSDAGQSWSQLDLGVAVTTNKMQVIVLRDEYEAELLISGVGGITGLRLLTTVTFE